VAWELVNSVEDNEKPVELADVVMPVVVKDPEIVLVTELLLLYGDVADAVATVDDVPDVSVDDPEVGDSVDEVLV
jgi:hypothetical protein